MSGSGERVAIRVNGQLYGVDPDTPLLWLLRDELGLTAAKYGCGDGDCGACTVLAGDVAVFSCQVMAGDLDAPVTTLEAAPAHPDLARIQRAWIRAQVPQCGYCQPGMIMSVCAVLRHGQARTVDEVMALVPNLCRCGTWPAVRQALGALLAEDPDPVSLARAGPAGDE